MGSVFPLCSGSQVSLLFIVPDRLCRAGLCLCSTFICTKCSCCLHHFRRVQGVPLSHLDTTRLPAGASTCKVLLLLPFPGRKPNSSQIRGVQPSYLASRILQQALHSRHREEDSCFPFWKSKHCLAWMTTPQSFPGAPRAVPRCAAVPALMSASGRALPTAF